MLDGETLFEFKYSSKKFYEYISENIKARGDVLIYMDDRKKMIKRILNEEKEKKFSLLGLEDHSIEYAILKGKEATKRFNKFTKKLEMNRKNNLLEDELKLTKKNDEELYQKYIEQMRNNTNNNDNINENGKTNNDKNTEKIDRDINSILNEFDKMLEISDYEGQQKINSSSTTLNTNKLNQKENTVIEFNKSNRCNKGKNLKVKGPTTYDDVLKLAIVAQHGLTHVPDNHLLDKRLLEKGKKNIKQLIDKADKALLRLDEYMFKVIYGETLKIISE